MAKTDFADKWAASSQDTLVADRHLNDPGDGIQAEFEERLNQHVLAGVMSGLTPSIATTSIAVATGVGYGLGKKYAGGDSITFVGASAGTYYVYWDASAEVLAKALTSAGAIDTDDDILLAQVVWDGATTLSALVSLIVWGIAPMRILDWCCGASTIPTGVSICVPVAFPCFIDYVSMVQVNNGSASGSIVDVHVGPSGGAPTTIFTTQGRRPSCSNSVTDYTVTVSGVPDGDRTLDAGDIITIEVDQVGVAAQGLGVTIWGRLRRA